MAVLGSAVVFISANVKNLNTSLAEAERNVKRSVGSIVDASGRIGTAMTGVGLGIVGVAGGLTKMAMDAVESENLFEVSMGNMAGAARQWSDELSKSLGLNAYDIRKNVGMMDAMLKSMGQSEQAAYDMSTGLTKLSYDMASFFNLKPDEAFEKLRSGIAGEAEPLKQLGILINDAAIKAYALEHEIGKVEKATGAAKPTQEEMNKTLENLNENLRVEDINYQAKLRSLQKAKMSTGEYTAALEKARIQHEHNVEAIQAKKTKLEETAQKEKEYKIELDDSQKTMIRYQLIMERTALAQGDLARTMDSPTNQLRRMKEQISMTGVQIGMSLLPALDSLLKSLAPMIQGFAQFVSQNPETVASVTKLVLGFGLINLTLGPVLMSMKGIVSVYGTARGVISATASALGMNAASAAAAATANQAAATSATAASVASGGLVGKIGMLAGRLSLVVGVAGLGWAFGRWLDTITANTAFGRWLDSVMDKVSALYEGLKSLLGLGADRQQLGARSQALVASGQVKQYASGGILPRTGLAIVGEHGPEVLNLQGGRVHTAADSARMLAGGVNINLTINTSAPVDGASALEHARVLSSEMRRRRA